MHPYNDHNVSKYDLLVEGAYHGGRFNNFDDSDAERSGSDSELGIITLHPYTLLYSTIHN